MKKSRLTVILDDVEGDGLIPGSEAFEREVRSRKVAACRDIHSVYSCYDCPHHDHCELFRQYMLDLTEVVKANRG